jgi:hypothetical protein
MKSLSSASDLAAIRARIALLRPTDIHLWGSMSVQQMVCHLSDSFACPLGERIVTAIKSPPIPVHIFKWLALYFPRKWPPGVPTPPEIDQRIGGTPPGDFDADRTALLEEVLHLLHSHTSAAHI